MKTQFERVTDHFCWTMEIKMIQQIMESDHQGNVFHRPFYVLKSFNYLFEIKRNVKIRFTVNIFDVAPRRTSQSRNEQQQQKKKKTREINCIHF